MHRSPTTTAAVATIKDIVNTSRFGIGGPTPKEPRGEPGPAPLCWAGDYLNRKPYPPTTPSSSVGGSQQDWVQQGVTFDLLNLHLDVPGQHDPTRPGGSPPKRVRATFQEASERGPEAVTMDAISRTLQALLRQEREVLTGEINKLCHKSTQESTTLKQYWGRSWWRPWICFKSSPAHRKGRGPPRSGSRGKPGPGKPQHRP